jgi:hypothetical protein
MLLVRSIDEYPHPVAHKTHQVGLKLVKDLTAARRFIMQKLVVGMLNIVDQFHLNVCDGDATRFLRSLFFLSQLSILFFNWRFLQYMQALTETARDVKVWKEFAMEASRCNGYSDFGRLLLKIYNVIPFSDDSLWRMDHIAFRTYLFLIFHQANCYYLIIIISKKFCI